jgi:RNA polymerase sigma-70 factor (ECF subfamily)
MSLDKPQLLAELLDRLGGALALYARQWTTAADDVVQEALVELAGQTEWPTNPRAWLFRVVRNRAVSEARRAASRHRHETAAATARHEWFDRRTRAQADLEEAAEVLAGLPLELREVVVAHFWGGLTFDEIGELTGTSSSTAHRRFESALLAMRERLEEPHQRETPCPNHTTKSK